MNKLKIINTTDTFWVSKGEKIAVSDMETAHIVRALAQMVQREKNMEDVKGVIPKRYHEEAETLNNMSVSDWIEVFNAELERRDAIVAAKEEAEIEKMVAEKMAAIEAERRVEEALRKRQE